MKTGIGVSIFTTGQGKQGQPGSGAGPYKLTLTGSIPSGPVSNAIVGGIPEQHNFTLENREILHTGMRKAKCLWDNLRVPKARFRGSQFIAHYNVCRRQETLRMPPAVYAKVTSSPWTMEELLAEAGVI